MTNWPEILAERLRPLAVPYPVYSYCNPDRAYNGETLIEFNENEYTVKTLLSGAEIRTYKLVVSCRAPEWELANKLTQEIKKLIDDVFHNLDSPDSRHALAGETSLVWDETGVSADVRGIVEGESFHGYAEFTIQERVSERS